MRRNNNKKNGRGNNATPKSGGCVQTLHDQQTEQNTGSEAVVCTMCDNRSHACAEIGNFELIAEYLIRMKAQTSIISAILAFNIICLNVSAYGIVDTKHSTSIRRK